MNKTLTAIALSSSLLTTACLPALDPTPQDASDTDAAPDTATPDASDASDASDPDIGDPSCTESTCTEFTRCLDGSCTIPFVDVPNDLRNADATRYGNTLAFSRNSLLIGAPNEEAVFSSTFDGSSFLTPAPIDVGTLFPGTKIGLFGAALDAHEGYAIVGSLDENPQPNDGTFPNRDGVVRIYKVDGDRWEPFNVIRDTSPNRNAIGDDGVVVAGISSEDMTTSIQDEFASRVTIDYPYFAASAPAFNPGGHARPTGRVSVWFRGEVSSTLARVTGVNNTDVGAQAEFGAAILLRGGHLFVGAPGFLEPGGSSACGAVHVFKLDEDVATELERSPLTPPTCASNGDAGASFGAALAHDGERLFVGAPNHSNGANVGSVFVYDMNSESNDTITNPLSPDVITAPENIDQGAFGRNLAPGGDHTLFVSVPGDSTGQRAGKILAFEYDSVDVPNRWTLVRSWSPNSDLVEEFEVHSSMAYGPGTVFVSATHALEERVYALDTTNLQPTTTP